MTESLVQAVCPHCKRTLKFESSLLAGPIRCKHCGQAMKRAPNEGRAPDAGPSSLSSDGNLMARYRERRKRRRLINLAVAAGLLLAVGIAALVYREPLEKWLSTKSQQIAHALEDQPEAEKKKEPVQPPIGPAKLIEEKKPTTAPPSVASAKPASKGNPDSPLLDPDDGVPAKPRKPAPRPSERSDVKPLRITGYPGRALLIGVKNYLYVNPVNPGYRSTQSLHAGPLGFQSLRQSLIRDFGFAPDQVGELSDVAAKNPIPPIKGTIEKTIETFLEGCRPQDRVLLVYMGHAIEAVEKHMFWEERRTCLVPIEADPADPSGLIPLPWLYDQLGKCTSRQKLLILDVAHFDPEQGMARFGGDRMTEGMARSIAKVPDGVQVWTSCSAGEYSYQFASNGYAGSVFMHLLLGYTDLAMDSNRALLLKDPGMAEGVLPHVLLASMINEEVTKRVKERANLVQTPKFYGKEGPAPAAGVDMPPPTVTIAVASGSEKVADTRLIAGIVEELALAADHTSALNPDALPPFFEKNLGPYQPDYKDQTEFETKLKDSPFRQAIVTATKVMDKQILEFDKGFKYPGDEASFKKSLANIQEKPATLEAQLDDEQTRLDGVGKDRDKETSKRWQAHYDFVYARLLAKKIYVREYNFVLGNKLKKDAPQLKDPKNNNGWVVIPTERMQQKDTRDWEGKRQKLLDKLMKEHPGTPWEVLARREKAAFLGLTIQEAKVD